MYLNNQASKDSFKYNIPNALHKKLLNSESWHKLYTRHAFFSLLILEDLAIKDNMNTFLSEKFFLGVIMFLRSIVAISVSV